MKTKKVKVKPPPLSWRERGRRLGLMALAGGLTCLSFPFTTERDSNLWPLAWFAFVPFLEAIRGLRGKQAFWFGAFGGLVTNLGGFWWISEVLKEFGHLPFHVYWPLTLLNSFYQGLSLALIALFIARAARARPDALAPIWQIASIYTVVEWLFPMIFPWYLANGQYRFLPAIQLAELGGVMSITFVMVAFNAGLHRLWVHRALRADPARPELPRRALIATFLGTAVVLIYGQVRVVMVDSAIEAAPKLKLGLVEADIGIFEKQAKHLPPREQALTLHKNLLRHQIMSTELAAQGVELVVWPESSFFPLDDPFIKRSDRMAFGLGGGELAERAFDPASAGYVWRPLPGFSGARALAALSEDSFAVLTSAGVVFQTGGTRATSTLPAGDFQALALAAAPGFSRHEDGAKPIVFLAGKTAEGRAAIAHGRAGQPLQLAALGQGEALHAIAMRTGRDGVAVGKAGTIVEIEREQARVLDALTSKDLRAVAWGDVPGVGQVALAVGDGGSVLVRLEGAWREDAQPSDAALSAVVFDRRGEPWIGGRGGFVAVRSGGRWREERLPEPNDVAAIAVDPLGSVMVADRTGRLWVRSEGEGVWTRDTQATSLSGLGAIASADWVQAAPLPRDVRWVRQSIAPLPTLEAFVEEPAVELAGVAEPDRTAVQRGFRTPILFGGLTWAPPPPGAERRKLYNTAIMLDSRGRVVGTYDKVYLLAFGEYMPFGETFPWLYDAFPHAGRFSAGNEVRTFAWRGHQLGIMICYEDIMADFTGKLADLEPNVIINVTNDAWFGRTSEPWLHLALAVFRAVENRLALVRATNTGVSAFIDPTGRLVGATRLEDAESLVADVPLMQGTTVYGAIGNLFSWLLLVGLVARVVLERYRGWKAKKEAT